MSDDCVVKKNPCNTRPSRAYASAAILSKFLYIPSRRLLLSISLLFLSVYHHYQVNEG